MRTRSKRPLTNTSLSSIEGNSITVIVCVVVNVVNPLASFIPPDAEDPPTPMELDPEDLEWQTWLNDLLNPSGWLTLLTQFLAVLYEHCPWAFISFN